MNRISITQQEAMAYLHLLDWVFQGRTIPVGRHDLEDAYHSLYMKLERVVKQ